MDQERARRAGKNSDLTYSGGFVVGNDGKISSVLWDCAAFNAGLTAGSQIVAVNGRNFDRRCAQGRDQGRQRAMGRRPSC